jgi:hypothetical protein
VVAVEQVVAEDRVLHAVAVDAGAARHAVVEDDVVLDQGARDDAVAALAQVSVHVDAVGVVAPHHVAADDGPVAAVRDIDPVLGLRAGHHVVLDQEVVAEASENAPAAVEVAGIAADDHVMVQDRADAGARNAGHGEALDHDVARPFEVDAVLRGRVLGVDDRSGLAPEGDGIGRGPARGQVEARVVPGPHDHQVAGAHRVRGLL